MAIDHPWVGKSWAEAAEAANTGMNGQGYIVDALMRASRAGTYVTYAIIGLMVVQIIVAIIR